MHQKERPDVKCFHNLVGSGELLCNFIVVAARHPVPVFVWCLVYWELIGGALMRRVWISGLILFLAASPLAAQDYNFGVYVGAFFPSVDTDIRVDPAGSDGGTSISLEGDLKFDSSDNVFRFGGFWRFAKRHRLFVDFYDIERSTRTQIQGDLIIDDDVFPVDTVLSAEFNTNIIPIYYEYSLIQSERTEIGIGLGVHWLDLEFAIAATNSDLAEFADASGPLPMLGASFDHFLSDQWVLTGSLYALSANVNDIDGDIISARIGVEYLFSDQFSAGLAYDYFDLDVELNKSDWDGQLGYQYDGAALRLRYRF